MYELRIQGIRRWIQGSAKLQSRGKKTIGWRRVPDMGNHRRSVEQFWWTPGCKENIQASKFLVLCFLKLANRHVHLHHPFVSDLLSCGNGSSAILTEVMSAYARLLFCKNKKHWNRLWDSYFCVAYLTSFSPTRKTKSCMAKVWKKKRPKLGFGRETYSRRIHE